MTLRARHVVSTGASSTRSVDFVTLVSSSTLIYHIAVIVIIVVI